MHGKTIIEQYRKADLNKRLCIYLEYRDLRDEFNRIDDESCRDSTLKKGRPWRNWAARFL